ncbi:hypothetical protein BC831DRAFT_486789 [Entophlyctis helioformis]|nr:hypothetical protein BC831DRAFT_486789 [Entophlyctis helioformis]
MWATRARVAAVASTRAAPTARAAARAPLCAHRSLLAGARLLSTRSGGRRRTTTSSSSTSTIDADNDQDGDGDQDADEPYTLQTFKDTYPLAMAASRFRAPATDSLLEGAQWWESQFLIPIRRTLSNLAGKGWLNGRLTDTSAEAEKDSAGNDMDLYIPDQFIAGATSGITALFRMLSTPPSPAWHRLLKPELQATLIRHASALHSHGLRPTLTLVSLDNVAVRDIWFTFGDGDVVTTTLNRAPVVETFGALSVLRKTRLGGQPIALYREVGFEYAMERGDYETDDDGKLVAPPIAVRGRMIKKGQVVGIDVVADAEIDVTISRVGSTDNADGAGNADADGDARDATVWTRTIKRPILVRFETDHFMQELPETGWRIADIDNWRASKMYD